MRRRERGLAPFTVMSCDNIQGNGDVARRSFTAFASLRSAELGEWVRTQVHFPNSMVDRITPATTDDDRVEVARRFGIDDAWPVVCEPFTQWVLEESFTAGRPPFEQVGVQVVDDVEPYELMKLRLLNASHQALCYLGHLAGYRLVHEVAQDPLFAELLLSYMDVEATPTLHAVPGIDLDDYKHTLISRFSNAGVRDTVARLCAESSDRIPTWLLPVVRENLAHGGQVHRAALVMASLGALRRGHRRAGRADHGGRPARPSPAGRGRSPAGGSAGVPARPGAVRRPRRRAAVHRALPRGAGLTAPPRLPRHPAGPAALATRTAGYPHPRARGNRAEPLPLTGMARAEGRGWLRAVPVVSCGCVRPGRGW